MPPRLNLDGQPDPDGERKDFYEEEWGSYWGYELGTQYNELFAELEQQEQPRDPGPDWWAGWLALFLAFAVPSLQKMAEEAALTQMDEFGVGIDFDEVVSQAANWASTYGFNLVTGLNTRTQQQLQAALQAFYQSGATDLEMLRSSLISTFGPVRASMIATTEVTRGFERGKSIFADILRGQGMNTEPVWNTLADEKVCQICAPNHGKRRSEGWTVAEIPAHVNCRCYGTLALVKG